MASLWFDYCLLRLIQTALVLKGNEVMFLSVQLERNLWINDTSVTPQNHAAYN